MPVTRAAVATDVPAAFVCASRYSTVLATGQTETSGTFLRRALGSPCRKCGGKFDRDLMHLEQALRNRPVWSATVPRLFEGLLSVTVLVTMICGRSRPALVDSGLQMMDVFLAPSQHDYHSFDVRSCSRRFNLKPSQPQVPTKASRITSGSLKEPQRWRLA